MLSKVLLSATVWADADAANIEAANNKPNFSFLWKFINTLLNKNFILRCKVIEKYADDQNIFPEKCVKGLFYVLYGQIAKKHIILPILEFLKISCFYCL